MPNQVLTTVENNFTKGLITDSTGFNFPENAATDADNCEFTLVGETLRRLGIDFEDNFDTLDLDRTDLAESTYVWKNAGGDGNTQLYVAQIGGIVHFWNITAATSVSPISSHILVSTIALSSFVAAGGSLDTTVECTYSDGNGYLFIYHPSCDPIYCTYNAGAVAGNRIIVKVRDFVGVLEDGVADNFRPLTLNDSHKYNLINQGWIAGSPWSAVSVTSNTIGVGAKTFTIATGLTITAGQSVVVTAVPGGGLPSLPSTMTGTVTSYNSGTGVLVLSIVSTSGAGTFTSWTIVPVNSGYINTWFSAIGNYPSNADVWWNFKNTSNVFDPLTTQANVSIGSGPAPKGSMIVDAFNQQRDTASGVATITDITTTVRPRLGTWFQGRVWYTGVDSSFAATGTADNTSWTENIYFSQIINSPKQLGYCYQTNDPTSEVLFDLLPTDGGVIQIQGCGSIYKLFPIQNGMLIFAANGVWFITGSQGIGFSANDYTITKISAIQSMSSTSFVDVQGLPYFWNEDGIYSVQPVKGGGLEVSSITVGILETLYDAIPSPSKKYVRGSYNPIDYVIQWIYKDTEEVDVTDRYSFNKILNFNTYNKAFYPYSVDITNASINSINYINTPGSSAITPEFKYFSSYITGGAYGVTFASLRDTAYVDWASTSTSSDFDSYFVTGYKLHGQGQRRFQLPYIYIFSKPIENIVSYKIQGLWDYANTGNSGRWSTAQIVNIDESDFNIVFRRHKLRGQGLVLQIKIKSVTGQPFNVIGWSCFETQNTGV